MAQFEYNATATVYGEYDPDTNTLYLGPNAARQHYLNQICLSTYFGTECFGGPDVKGIDCTAEIVAHELYHKWVADQNKTGGQFFGRLDYDYDGLPDYYEETVSHTSSEDPDTYGLSSIKNSEYGTYGDNEYMAMREGKTAAGIGSLDWANPGRQTEPSDQEVPIGLLASLGTTQSVNGLEYVSGQTNQGSVRANFTGNFSDYGNDTDGDGLYNYLRVSAQVNVTNGGSFNLLAFLSDKNGNQITYVNEPLTLSTGVQSILFDFDGIAVQKNGSDGPYNVTMQLTSDEGFLLDKASYFTGPYQAAAFQVPAAVFSDVYSDQAVDTDGDGLYNYLSVMIGVNVAKPQNYSVNAWLYDGEGNEIADAVNTTYLNVGSQSLMLNFDGLSINRHRADGPYLLKYLGIRADSPADSRYDAYNTTAYSYGDFQAAQAQFSGTYSDQGVDIDNAGVYDYLQLGVAVDVVTSGNYAIVGSLCDQNGVEISEANSIGYLDSGSQMMWLAFPGAIINQHGVDGQYNLASLALYSENGTLMDTLTNAYNTSAYQHSSFAGQTSPIPEFTLPTLLPTLTILTMIAVAVLRRKRKLP